MQENGRYPLSMPLTCRAQPSQSGRTGKGSGARQGKSFHIGDAMSEADFLSTLTAPPWDGQGKFFHHRPQPAAESPCSTATWRVCAAAGGKFLHHCHAGRPMRRGDSSTLGYTPGVMGGISSTMRTVRHSGGNFFHHARMVGSSAADIALRYTGNACGRQENAVLIR